MEKEDAIEKIIRSRIKTIVCIDDEYETPYSNSTTEMEEVVYKSLAEHSNGFVRMIKYDGSESISGIKGILDITDLIVLDWELDAKSIGREYEPTLALLDEVMKSNCPFICLYTQERDLLTIYEIIYCYYLGVSKMELRENATLLTAIGADSEEIESIIHKYLFQGNDSVFIEFWDHLPKGKRKLITEKFGDNNSEAIIKRIMLQVFHYKRHENVKQSGLSNINQAYIRKGNEIISININGKILTVFAKRKNSMGDGEIKKMIAPNELFNTFASTICSAPNNIYNALWMDYQNNLRKTVYNSQSSFLENVSDKMLLILKKKVEEEADEKENRAFEKELISHFNDDLIHQLYNLELNIDDSINEKIENVDIESIANDEFVSFNALYSQNRKRIDMNNSIRFGDLFYVSEYIKDIDEKDEDQSISYSDIKEKILLCITAHCDCSHTGPTIKTKNNFSFAIGTVMKATPKILKNPEAGKDDLYDFIMLDGSARVVKWDKYFTKVYLESLVPEYNDGCLCALYKGCMVKIKFIGNLKENYTQRIANNLYSYANRVGITYLGTKQSRARG